MRRWREAVQDGIKRGITRLCGWMGVSSKQFGSVKGRHATAQAYHKKVGSAHAKILPFRPEHSSQTAMPKTGGAAVHERFHSPHIHDHPATFLLELTPGRVISPTGFVIGTDDMLIDDVSALYFGKTRPEPQPYPILRALRLPPCRKFPGTLAVITTNNTHNYFHWLTDALPRVEIVRKLLPRALEEVDAWLVPSGNPLVAETVAKLGIPADKLLTADSQTHWEASRLVVPSPPGMTGSVPAWVAEFLRKEFLASGTEGGFSKRIFVSRAGGASRRILNEAEVMGCLGKLGFQAYRLEEMTFQDQIGLFRSAEVVVAPHGAGLTNLLWAPEGVKVVEIFSPNYVNVCYWLTAGRVNAEYTYLCGKGDPPPPGTDSHLIQDHIEVDLAQLRKALATIGLG